MSHLVTMTETCALDLADRGPMGGEEVARVLHTTRRSIIADQHRATRKLGPDNVRMLIEVAALHQLGRGQT